MRGPRPKAANVSPDSDGGSLLQRVYGGETVPDNLGICAHSRALAHNALSRAFGLVVRAR